LANIVPLDGPLKEAAPPQRKQALAHAPAEADPVIPPRNPAAALPLPDEADFHRLSPLVR